MTIQDKQNMESVLFENVAEQVTAATKAVEKLYCLKSQEWDWDGEARLHELNDAYYFIKRASAMLSRLAANLD